ncbi:hypothetical protein HD806DRAFT_487435 [Xylariaceae sp. AK1471]|nr:hypothetical protein HD806DRAFT_487435 [Xylariaceae sp. AK1471]
MSKKAKKGKKKKRETGNGTGLPWDVTIEEQSSEIEGKEQTGVQDEAGNLASTAFTTTSMNAKARRRLKRAQQNSTSDNHTQSEPKPMPMENGLEPMPRPVSLFGDGFGTPSS